MTVRILRGNCLEVLQTLAAQSVHCCVTSPPYWGLRDYGTEPLTWPAITYSPLPGLPPCVDVPAMDASLGLEPTLEAFIGHMVLVFREVRRVLRGDGTLWMNMGDSYNNSDKWGGGGKNTGKQTVAEDGSVPSWMRARKENPNGLKPKDLFGQPWRLAFALQADGWWLRQEVIWHKPNPMPESITDRCTKAHEQIFLLSKSPRYYFDQDAIRTPLSVETKAQSFDTMDFKARDRYKMPDGWDTGAGGHGSIHREGREKGRSARDNFKREASKRAQVIPGQTMGTHRPDREDSAYRLDSANKRSVWTVATESFKEAHFATFPSALIEPCILAGCPIGGTVLDPFGGSGTTGLVADRHQRDAILIELNPSYADMAERRIVSDAPLFTEVSA